MKSRALHDSLTDGSLRNTQQQWPMKARDHTINRVFKSVFLRVTLTVISKKIESISRLLHAMQKVRWL